MADLLSLPSFLDGDTFLVVVESPRGASVKLKYDPQLGVMSVSRPLALGLAYPYDWGFVPSTEGPDGDPIDAVVLWDVASFPAVAIPCTALGVIQVEQNRPDRPGERMRNDRVLAVPVSQRRRLIESLPELPKRVRDELAHFLVAATVFEGKDPQILGWGDAAAALALIRGAAVS
jgi:inorganic pyrophosphatase